MSNQQHHAGSESSRQKLIKHDKEVARNLRERVESGESDDRFLLTNGARDSIEELLDMDAVDVDGELFLCEFTDENYRSDENPTD